jgi:hypothetical protein
LNLEIGLTLWRELNEPLEISNALTQMGLKRRSGAHASVICNIKSSLKLAVSFLIPKQHLSGLDRFLTLKPAPDGLLDPKAAPLGLGSLTDTRPVRRLDLSSLAHLGLKAEHRCFQSRLDIRCGQGI